MIYKFEYLCFCYWCLVPARFCHGQWWLSVALDIKAVPPNHPPLCAPHLAAAAAAVSICFIATCVLHCVVHTWCAYTQRAQRCARPCQAECNSSVWAPAVSAPPSIRQKRGQLRSASEVRAGHDGADACATRWRTTPMRCGEGTALPAPSPISCRKKPLSWAMLLMLSFEGRWSWDLACHIKMTSGTLSQKKFAKQK